MPERIVDVFDETGVFVTSYTVILAGSDARRMRRTNPKLSGMAAFDAAVPADRLAGLTAKVRR